MATPDKEAKEATGLAPEPQAPAAVRQAMQDRDYAAAVKAIDAAMAGDFAAKDYLAYLKGRALHLSEKYDEAIARFDTIEKEFPKSEWIRRARFGMAVSLARKGDFRAAELIYRREAEYLLSADRKQEIADLYLEFANTYFKPPKEEQQPDYQKALGFFQNALAVGPKPEKKREVEMLVAECFFKLNNFAEAARLYGQFVKDYPDAAELVEAKFRLGESQLKQGQLAEARRTWQDLLAAHADNKSPRIAEATFDLSLTYQMPNPPSDEDLGLGVAALDAFVKKFPDHKLASLAHLRIAQSYVNRGRHDDAAKRITAYLADARYADREETPDARALLGQALLLQKKFTEALAAWRDYLAKHPTHGAWSSVQQAIVDTQFTMAAERREAKDYAAARKLWTEFLANYPLDPRGPTIWYTFGVMNFEQEKWDGAIADWTRLASKYPNTGEASRAQLMIGVVLETKQGKLAAALEQYRKVTGPSQNEAAQRIVQLTAKTMTVATERVFRSNETPTLKLTSRNIDAVSVRIYAIDLETYFRKMHLAGGVEGLDISLIDPDQSFEFKVPKYAEYQELESAVEVPLPERVAAAKSGAMAVTISSKTLTATTLVLQSDLDIIVKSSRNEVFVLAENMVTGKPWKDVRLLISNGEKVFAEAKTGDDGVFKGDYKELLAGGTGLPTGGTGLASDDVRVFAVAGSHTGSNVVGLEGVGVATGLADKGYIYTDRPAYRPGDMVHVRGVIRGVAGDAFTIDEGAKYSIQVFDPRNRLLHEAEAALSEFGGLGTHFLLPSAAVQGEYRVLVTEAAKEIAAPKSYQGTFGVQEYRLEPVRIAVESDRTVYYRGEEIKGKIRVQFYYGAPVVGADVRYQLADQAVTTAKTNDQGEIEFTFATREFRETQTLPLVVTLPERNLGAVKPFVLATKGFSIAVSTVRPVYLAGESFEASLKTVDAEGKPIAQKLNLKVLERTTVDGRVGERLVSEYAVETDKEGNARQTLKLVDGGKYILRAEGTDRFENPIFGTSMVQLSDDKDAVRLRMLADRHTFKVGDVAKVNLHWREAPALALVTFQGARVLDYKLVTLKTGDNPLELPMTAQLAPNFELAVAVMTDTRPAALAETVAPTGKLNDADKPVTRLHLASSLFTVDRELKVSVEIKRKNGAAGDAKPGEEVDVVVTTTDAQGKPVAAEVSLAMIEQSLLEQFSFAVPSIQDFFGGGRRETAVRTTASITFNYRPATQAINPRLLAEEDRKALEMDEAAKLELAASLRSSAAGAAGGNSNTESAARPSRAGGGRILFSPEAALPSAGDVVTRPDDTAGEEIPADEAPADGPAGVPNFKKREIANEYYAVLGAQTIQSVERFSRDKDGTMSGKAFQWSMASKHSGFVADLPANEDLAYAESKSMAGFGMAPRAKEAQLQAGDDMQSVRFGVNFGDTNGTVAFSKLSELGRRDVVVVDRWGKMSNVFFAELGDAEQMAEGKRLAEAGAMMLPQLIIQETGYWNPSVVTDKDGKATVAVTLPDRSTAWKLLAKGATKETLCGEADASLAVKKDLFGELKLPLAFTDGDKAEIAASVHNHAVDKGTIKVTLKTTIGGASDVATKTIDVAKQGIEKLSFERTIRRSALAEPVPPGAEPVALGATNADEMLIELTVEADGKSDVVRRRLPIRPFGLPVYNIAGGSAAADTTAWVEAPANVSDDARSLQILLGPTVERSLVDVLFGPAPICQIDNVRLASSLDTATSDALSAIALAKLLSDNDKAATTVQSLDARLRSTVSLLVAAQNDDGGWSWTGEKGTASHRYTSARVVWALALARKAGYRVPDDGFDKACNYLAGEIAKTRDDDYESKAILLHALATAGRDDFALAKQQRQPPIKMVHVLIVGGGFAGLNAAKGLGGVAGIEVTLVDRTNHHLFQPLLYQVAMAGLSPADIAAPIRSLLSRYRNIGVLQGEVSSIDLARKAAVVDFGELTFDYLILACGARHSYFGHDEWEEFAPGLKTLEQAT
ncbi:MAG: tetratricopeptide repeat protein, partial [Pirellulales bacterium]